MIDNQNQSDKIRLTLAPGLGPTGYEVFEKDNGPYVLFDDIAHLLKPQEPGESLVDLLYEERQKLKDENKRMREALKFYAEQEVYTYPSDWDWPGMGRGPNFDECDEVSYVASEALKPGEKP